MRRDITPGVISDPDILGGRPVLRGRRIAVSQLVDQLAGGMTARESATAHIIQRRWALSNH